MTSFDKKMATMIATAAGSLLCLSLLAGCGVTIPAAAGAATALGVSAATVSNAVNVATTIYTDGQLLCNNAGLIVAVVDTVTKQPVLVTGKAPSVVAGICTALGSTAVPISPPQTVVSGAPIAAATVKVTS